MQALFRPMSMMIPDYALVAEVMLFSEGFEDSKNLSRKMVNLYKLSSEQLSQQVRGCARSVLCVDVDVHLCWVDKHNPLCVGCEGIRAAVQAAPRAGA